MADDAALKIYEVYLDDLGRIGSRHESARQYYITVVAALFTFLGLAGKEGLLKDYGARVDIVVGAVGAAICALWFTHMLLYAGIYSAKFSIIEKIEGEIAFPIHPFTCEDKTIRALWRPKLTGLDETAAVVVGLLFLACIFFGLHSG